MERFDLVQKAFDDLVKEGKIFPVSTPSVQEEEQKALLTRRAAYYLYQAGTGFGLLRKTSGNRVKDLSVDIVTKKDGTYHDIATNKKVNDSYTIVKIYDSNPKQDASFSAKWVEPTRELADITDSHSDTHSDVHSDVPTTPDDPGNSVDIKKYLDIIESTSKDMVALKQEVANLTLAVDTLKVDLSKKIEAIKPCLLRFGK